MQHFRSDQPASYLTPMPLFSDNALVDTKPLTFERVANTRTTTTYNPASTQRGRRFASVNNSYPNFPATTSTPTHNTYSQQLRSPLNPISHNARPSRASFSQTTAPADSKPYTHNPDPRSETPFNMQNQIQPPTGGPALLTAQFQRVLQGIDQPLRITGTASALQKLTDILNAGFYIRRLNDTSATTAFELSLRPYQIKGFFPTDAEMTSLSNLPKCLQLASGFNSDQDLTMAPTESAANHILPPLAALRVIDGARRYMEIGDRLRHGYKYCFDMLILTRVNNHQFLVHELPLSSGTTPSTHSVLLFRQFVRNEQGNLTEEWSPSITVRGIPPPRAQPIPVGAPLAANAPPVAGPSNQPQPPMPPAAQPAQTAQTTHNWGNGNGVDPLIGVTDPNTVEGDLILRVAMRYTNKEIHQILADKGSTAKYNSITKRISNALKAQARAELQPGERLNAKCNALREEFDTQRNASLGRQPAQRGGGNGGVGKSKRRKTGSKTFVAGDDSDMEEEFDEMDLDKEEDTDMEDDEEDGAGGGYSLRSSNRAPRANTAGQTQDEVDVNDVEDDLGGQDDGDDSDGSVYDGT
ncbi:hypothetical protein CB0940_03632 [Cercospora beticola]|uniref:Uncharacterized protein n=1 Tax=Cercospora beticola TaxID=122368 RepID=A0A2G5I2B3_CERBT|nr:hypothetical protein CB0940_03632 [Cercospora beticola]PIA98919.1 hypothetical protein CB0940_03632 [Cercospora beticola]WPB00812.1 hypothetical protein RHO25_005432 [Cercospora beticola]